MSLLRAIYTATTIAANPRQRKPIARALQLGDIVVADHFAHDRQDDNAMRPMQVTLASSAADLAHKPFVVIGIEKDVNTFVGKSRKRRRGGFVQLQDASLPLHIVVSQEPKPKPRITLSQTYNRVVRRSIAKRRKNRLRRVAK